MLKKYNIPVPHVFDKKDLLVEDDLFASMWELFFQIGQFWKNGKFTKTGKNPAVENSIKSQLMDFMNNRIEQDPTYLGEYKSAGKVIQALIEDHGEKQAYKILFTTSVDPRSQPTTAFERARIKVSNEFVLLQLALGGFKSFGAKNYLGYFGGANVEGKPPYRTYPDKD